MVNKGAQAMIFVTVSEIRKREPDAEIIVFVYDKWKSEEDPKKYNMKFVPITMKEIMQLSHTLLGRAYALKKGFKKNNKRLNEIKTYLTNAKMAFDISGYALSNQWGVGACLFYLSKFALLEQYNIPTYVMPQSFGPFDFPSVWESRLVKHYTKKYLKYPKIVFAREQDGYDCMVSDIKLKNIELSYDLVLQNKDIDINTIFLGKPKLNKVEITTSGNVAIIPNVSNSKHNNSNQLMHIYKQIIDYLFLKKKNIYLITHSSQDLEMCKQIMSMYTGHNNIKLISDDLNCIEYSLLIQKFDYVIASRFHSIVHAYKEYVPCIALGWAKKYFDLLSIFKQEQFNFDVREKIEIEKLLNSLMQMENTYNYQSKFIEDKLQEVQAKTCFELLDINDNVDN